MYFLTIHQLTWVGVSFGEVIAKVLYKELIELWAPQIRKESKSPYLDFWDIHQLRITLDGGLRVFFIGASDNWCFLDWEKHSGRLTCSQEFDMKTDCIHPDGSCQWLFNKRLVAIFSLLLPSMTWSTFIKRNISESPSTPFLWLWFCKGMQIVTHTYNWGSTGVLLGFINRPFDHGFFQNRSTPPKTNEWQWKNQLSRCISFFENGGFSSLSSFKHSFRTFLHELSMNCPWSCPWRSGSSP